jgi:hypothetical protein
MIPYLQHPPHGHPSSPAGYTTLTDDNADLPPAANSPASVTDLAISENSGAASTTPPDTSATSETYDSESESDSQGWVALEDLPRYNSSENAHFLDDEEEHGEKNGTTHRIDRLTAAPSHQTWRADFDDVTPFSDEAAAPFDLNPAQLDAVKIKMQSITIDYKPEWAEAIAETKWRKQLQSRLEGREAKG